MPIDEVVKEYSQEFWKRFRQRHALSQWCGVDQYDPKNFYAIEQLFEASGSHGIGLIESLTEENKILAFRLGAFIGEIARHYHGSDCKWIECGGYEGAVLELPIKTSDQPVIVNPMELAASQIKQYKPGDFVAWGKDKAHLKIPPEPKVHIAKFGHH